MKRSKTFQKNQNQSKRISKLSSETPVKSASTALLSPAGERHHLRAELLKKGLYRSKKRGNSPLRPKFPPSPPAFCLRFQGLSHARDLFGIFAAWTENVGIIGMAR